jgi:hypothetical protein
MVDGSTAPVVIADNDWETWGKLIKSWATRENRVNPGGPSDQYPIPQTVDEMKAQMTAAGMKGFVIPPRIKAVHFVWYNSEVLVIKLAPKKMITDGEDAVQAAPNYPLAPFYDRVYGHPLPLIPPGPERQRLHDERVGDYTIRACA